jgi:hypothetical protein
MSLVGRHCGKHPFVTSMPVFSKLGCGRYAGRRDADEQVAAIRFVPLTGDQLLEFQRAAEPANPALIEAQPISQLLLGRTIAIEQIDEQDTFGHGQRGFGQTSRCGVPVYRHMPHHPGEQRLQHLGVRRRTTPPWLTLQLLLVPSFTVASVNHHRSNTHSVLHDLTQRLAHGEALARYAVLLADGRCVPL